jgi:hypothetical protein
MSESERARERESERERERVHLQPALLAYNTPLADSKASKLVVKPVVKPVVKLVVKILLSWTRRLELEEGKSTTVVVKLVIKL